MRIRYEGVLHNENFPQKCSAQSLEPKFDRYFYRHTRDDKVHFSDNPYWTSSLYDLMLIGRWIAQGEVSPLGITVQIGYYQYVYGLEGDLYRLGIIGEPEFIRLSKIPYKEKT